MEYIKKKPEIISAVQWFLGSNHPKVEQVGAIGYLSATDLRTGGEDPRVMSGDYIVTDEDGYISGCRQVVFEETFKPYINKESFTPTDLYFDTTDPKYGILVTVTPQGEKRNYMETFIINAKTKTPIPTDEPIFIFRAKDVRAVSALKYYISLFSSATPHFAAIGLRIKQFVDFASKFPERMKNPDT